MALPATRSLPLGSGPAADSHAPQEQATSVRHVTACVDGSAMDRGVLQHAAALAVAMQVPLTVLHVVEPDQRSAPPDPIDWDVRRREAEAYVREAAAGLRAAAAIEARVELRQGCAAEQIRQWGLGHEGDVMVFCRHGEHGPEGRWSLSSTARKLVEGTPGSLLVVPSQAVAAGVTPHYGRIMVLLDGSLVAESAIPSAVGLAREHRAELIVAHIVPGPQLTQIGPPSEQDLDIEQQVIDRNQSVARAYLQRIRSDLYDTGLDVRVIVRDGGDVRERLEELVSEQRIDLMVLSSHGRTGPRDTACGSVAAYLLTHVPVPLLILRERSRTDSATRSSRPASADVTRHPLRAG